MRMSSHFPLLLAQKKKNAISWTFFDLDFSIAQTIHLNTPTFLLLNLVCVFA